MARTLRIALALALAAAWPSAAQARSKSLGKLSAYNLFGPMSLLGISGLLTQRSLAQAHAAGYEVSSADDAESKVGRDTLKKIRACDLKPACLADLSANLGGGLLLAGSLDRDEVHYLVRLVLVDLGSGKLVASAERQILIASRQLDTEFDAMLPDLLAGKSTAPTRLTLTSPQQHARAQLDDRPLGELPVTLEISPGRHEIKIEKADYLPSDRFVDIEAGTTTTLDLPLTLIPNRVDPDQQIAQQQAPPKPAPVPIAPEAVHAGGVPVATWISLGVAVAAGGVATYFALNEKSIANRAVADDEGVLSITRVEAQTGRRDATLANVCFIAAGVAAGTGALIWLTDDPGTPASSKSVKVGLAPLPRGGAASLAFGF